MSAASEPPGLRADAARNRRLLLDAAATVFAEHGTQASIAQIAQQAGVAKGTVFRHFPTKDDLVAAIICDQLDLLAAVGTRLSEAADPTAALFEFMTTAVDLQSRDRSLCQASGEAFADNRAVQAAADRLTEIAEVLTARAQAQQGIRDDVTGQDVILLLRGIYQAAAPLCDHQPTLWRRYLALVFEGLRSPATQPLPLPAPDLFSSPRTQAGRHPAP
ncbi:DNA-binding transcriptional regulator, AcrR family [Parafrankia irregularis]|uniref:DNA-binding transcriptional regulator, AcrR family n=1 Tax=Parafrankia irregularis TaxID=795642 RepID=A0A0S4QTU1_9ACTN|nr:MULTISPECIES: TetR/AcrR family transcriptional regulator [Parafrankia]MBE3203728.1 TetR/AcrR family transcriptional regulator [Parafrankia sp. CH37]CUU59029.1 DNA-binding transcriptional regulator, AcrR family [Parafrankia irregularis]